MDALVKEYLLKQGYTAAANELDKQIDQRNKRKLNNEDDPSISISLNNNNNNNNNNQTITKKSIIEQLLTSENLILNTIDDENNKDIYQKSYAVLRSWACNSLESIKAEILSLCFPIFVHCYVSLINRKQEEDAKNFWINWQKDHTDTYADELRHLSLLTSHQQLHEHDFINTNNFLKQLLVSKFIVKMSSFSYELLETFLVQNDLILIASIINEKVKIEDVLSKRSNNMFDPVELEGYIPNSKMKQDNNLVPLELGVPGKKSLDSNLVPPSTREDSFYRNCVMYLVRNRLYLNAKKAENQSVDIESEAPSSSSSSSSLVLEASEPSIIFATISNTYGGMTSMHISDDVVQVACGFRDSHIRVWRLDNDKNFASEYDNPDVLGMMQEVLPKPKNSLNGRLSSDGSKKGSSRGGGVPMLQLRGHSKAVLSVSQDETNRIILSSSADESIRIWDTSIGHCVGKFNCIGPAWDVSFGPLGYYFLAANQNRTACVYSTDRVSPIRLLTGHVSDVTCCRWHDNASLFITGSDDRTARMWDIRSGNCVRLFRGISNISSIVCSPAGGMVAGGADNGIIHLWDASSGKMIGLYQGHNRGSPVYSVAFNQDSTVLCSGAADSSVRVWDLKEVATSPRTASVGYPVYQTNNVYHTKYTPVYFVGYTEKNMLYAGGPVNLSSHPVTENSKVQELESLKALNINHTVPL